LVMTTSSPFSIHPATLANSFRRSLTVAVFNVIHKVYHSVYAVNEVTH
jgi:hypothetical protein